MDIFLYNKLCGASNLPPLNIMNTTYFLSKIKTGGADATEIISNNMVKIFKNKEYKTKILNYIQSYTKIKVKKIISDLVKQNKTDKYIFDVIKPHFSNFNYKEYVLLEFKKILKQISKFVNLEGKKIITYGYNNLAPELKQLGITVYTDNLEPNSYDIVILNYIYHKVPRNIKLRFVEYVKKDNYYYYYKHPEISTKDSDFFQFAKNVFEIQVLGFEEPPSKFPNGEYEMYFLSGEFIKQRMSGDISLQYGAQHKCGVLYEKKNNNELIVRLLFKCKPSGLSVI